MMAPSGDMKDGQFSLCIAGDANRRTILSLLPRFMKGTQEGHPVIEMRYAKKVMVEALHSPLPAHADGETLCEQGEKLVIEVLPKQLEILCELFQGSNGELS